MANYGPELKFKKALCYNYRGKHFFFTIINKRRPLYFLVFTDLVVPVRFILRAKLLKTRQFKVMTKKIFTDPESIKKQRLPKLFLTYFTSYKMFTVLVINRVD